LPSQLQIPRTSLPILISLALIRVALFLFSVTLILSILLGFSACLLLLPLLGLLLILLLLLLPSSELHRLPQDGNIALLDHLYILQRLFIMDKPEILDISQVEDTGIKASGPPQTVFSLNDHDTKVARRLKWKIDVWCLPMITFIYFLAAMDRSDIGNAQTAGMEKVINATEPEWANIVSLFYIGFVIGQAAGVYTLRSLTPQIVLGVAIVIWGLAITCMIKVTTPTQAEGLRVIIGFCEGIDHAALLYLSLWCASTELATRSGIFYSASSLAGAFNGLIAYTITKNYAHKPPFEPWQWLFLIEGMISIGYSVILLILLPPAPEKIKYSWIANEHRLAVIRTLQANNTPGAKIR
jgi:hypothetical protein